MRAERAALLSLLVAVPALADATADAVAAPPAVVAPTPVAAKPANPVPAPSAAPKAVDTKVAEAAAAAATDAELLEFLGEFSSSAGFQDPFVLDPVVNKHAADALDKAVRMSGTKEDEHGQ